MDRIRYGGHFYRVQLTRSRAGARAIVPIVMDLLAPRSIVDLGCGVGCWLATFREAGVTELLGIDGSWVPRHLLQIPSEAFREGDVGGELTLTKTPRVDLAMSLEVGEHLEPYQASRLVASLTELSDFVLFSAATPFQGGLGHVNEQWPSYWASLFAQRGYVAMDAIRPLIWSDVSVPVWYRQNCILYVARTALYKHPPLRSLSAEYPVEYLDRVHPELFRSMVGKKVSATVRTFSQGLRVLRALRKVEK